MQKQKRERTKQKNIFGKIMTEKFSKLLTNNKPQFHKAQKTISRTITKKETKKQNKQECLRKKKKHTGEKLRQQEYHERSYKRKKQINKQKYILPIQKHGEELHWTSIQKYASKKRVVLYI